MIRMIQSTSATQAKNYFSDALQRSDYFFDGQEMRGQFHGKLAAQLGLTGDAEKEQFFKLCENVNPATGKPFTAQTKSNRTIGYDINFHCPKSLSIVQFLSPDNSILEAFQQSVLETMKEIERDTYTRVRKARKDENRRTGNLIYAEFTHLTSRPVDGALPDPHIHSHCYVFNGTFDPVEGQIKAAQFQEIKRSMPYYQARFHKRLSDKLIDLGYEIRRTDKAFEIPIPKKVIDHFKKRTDEIGQIASEKGIRDPRKLSELGARTRAKKQKGHSMSELIAEWKRQIVEDVKLEPGEETIPIRYAPNKEINHLTPEDAIDHSLRHCFERASVKSERRILEAAFRHSIGRRHLTLKNIEASFENDARIIRVQDGSQTVCTTKAVLAEEQRMVSLARSGQNIMQPLYEVTPELNDKLNEQQKTAITDVLTTSHQTSIVRGAAGTGKTTIMTEAKQHIEAAGKRLFVAAPTAQAARTVLKSEGFENAETVAKVLKDKEFQKQLFNQVLWVDEAGLLSTPDMLAILSIAKEQKAKLILGGDTRQHSAILRGDALKILNVVGGIRTSEVSKIIRQKDIHYREAVEDLSKGDVKSAFIKLGSIGAIKNVDPLAPDALLVEDYMKTLKNGRTALIVSPTHAQGNAVTSAVREKLREAGMIGKKDTLARKLVNCNLTEAEKADKRNIEVGQFIQFNQNVPKIKRGTLWKVTELSGADLIIENGDSKAILPFSRANSYDVFNEAQISLAKGDQVRITRNSYDSAEERMVNGQKLEVSKVDRQGKITLINRRSNTKYEIENDFGHIAHAYCTTSNSSQGITVDEVFVSQPASTFLAANAKQFYVSVSRGKKAAHIYTDDRKALLEYASEIGDRQSAMELLGYYTPTEYAVQKEIEKSLQPLDYGKQKTKITNFNKEEYEPGL